MTASEDGLGQSAFVEMRWALRFRRVRRLAVAWRSPTPEERRSICAHPIFGRFADGAVAIADWQERRWIVMERTWSGWPDPPTYVLFVLDGDAVWLARDFDRWPSAWREPWGEGHDGEKRRKAQTRRIAAHLRPFRDAFLLLAGVPFAFAGWWVGTRLALDGWSEFGKASLLEAEALLWFSAVFALAATTRLLGRRVRAAWRRSAVRLRSLARDRWGKGRTRQEFARVYRPAVGAVALAVAVLVSALLAGLGIDGLDQSLVLVTALATVVFSRLVLQIFRLAGFRPAICLLACFATSAFAGGLWLR